MVQVAITQSSLRFSTIKLISILAATLSIILNFTNWNNLEEITYLFFFTDSLIQVKAQEINMFSLKKNEYVVSKSNMVIFYTFI